MPDLSYVPPSEFARLNDLPLAPVARTEIFATFARINTLYAIARAGSGHIGSSFSSLDIVSWLFLNEMRIPADGDPAAPRDIYFSSKGHDAPGLYGALTGLGLLDFDLIHQLRRLDGLPGHPDVGTPMMVTNTGSLGMGISKAKGMVQAKRLKGESGRIFVLTGDGELQEGQFWESLHSAVNHGLHEITAIIDHNKLQSDTFVSKVSDLGDLDAKLAAFGWAVARCDGNDLNAFSTTLSKLLTVTDKPKILIADTIKGRGVSFMEHTALGPEDTLYRFHSGAPSDEHYAAAVAELIDNVNARLRAAGAGDVRVEQQPRPERASADGMQRMIPAYSAALIEQAERNERIVALDGDLILDTGLIPFQERFPERFFECGIAEMDMVSQAGGMALQGLLPAVHSFACFLSTRPNEQIYNNCTEHTKIVYAGSLAGLLPGGPGHSHQSVRDISALGAMPGLILIEPCNEQEVGQAVEFAFAGTTESCYLRLVSIPCAIPYQLPDGYRLEEGRGVALTHGRDAVLFGYGPVMLPQAYRAAALLQEQHGISVTVVNLPWLNRVDAEWLKQTVAGYRHVFTLDDHYISGGQGEMIAARLAELGLGPDVRVHAFGVTEVPACGQNDEVLRAHRLDAESLVGQIARLMDVVTA